MISRVEKTAIYLLLFLTAIITVNLMATVPADVIRPNACFNVMNLAESNGFLLQSIFALTVVMIFGYAGKLYYERNIKKE